MGRVWLEAATLAHGECALLLVKTHCDLEKIDQFGVLPLSSTGLQLLEYRRGRRELCKEPISYIFS